MNLRQITYFCKIADERSFSAAARALNIAQSALSLHISNLEHELGTQLLVRTTSGVELTDTGRILLAHARKILTQLRLAKEDVLHEASVPKGSVSIVLPPMLGRHIGPALLKRVRANLPMVELEVSEALGLRAQQMVESGRCDLGIIASVGTPENIGSVLLYKEALYLVESASTGSSAADNDTPVSLAEAVARPLAMSRQRHAVRAVVETVTRTQRLPLNISVETESSRLLIGYIMAGVAAGILPWPSVCDLWQRGEVTARRISSQHLLRHVWLTKPRGYQPTVAANAVQTEIIAILNDLRSSGIIKVEALGELLGEGP